MSIWNKKEIKTEREELEKDLDVDILIIGAGITGLTTAYYLKDQKSICVVDANVVGHGVTLNTTAKINYFQERIYTKIATSTNITNAKKYLKSQLNAIEYIKDIIEKENIECDFTKVPSYVFANTKKEVEPLKKEVLFLKNNGINVLEKDLPSKITSYISYCVNDTYIFNPIKYLQGIYDILKNKNIKVYENSKITRIESKENRYICYGLKYKIRANKVILATHYPYFLIPLFIPAKTYIEKSYIIVSRVKEDKRFTFISSSTPTYSSRYYNDGKNIYQISLAESHNTAFKQNDLYHFKRVKEIFNLKDSDIVMKYTNVDIITSDNMPYIGSIKNNMYIACGYNTWGMTNGILAAKIISDLVLGKENKYEKLFNPMRFNFSNLTKLPYIIFSQTKSFLGPKLIKNKYWYNNVKFDNINGKCIAIYKDKNGFEHSVYNKCPHLGCSLIFNELEQTWDCPCHSSRFDIDGNCIKGPSNYDITYKK